MFPGHCVSVCVCVCFVFLSILRLFFSFSRLTTAAAPLSVYPSSPASHLTLSRLLLWVSELLYINHCQRTGLCLKGSSLMYMNLKQPVNVALYAEWKQEERAAMTLSKDEERKKSA